MKERNTKIWTALDLEMNQPSGKIIQIGAVKFNIDTAQVYDSINILVKIDEPLCTDDSICNIPQLTGITEARLAKDGVDLMSAYKQTARFHNAPVMIDEFTHTYGMVNPVVWGCGDNRTLRQQVQEAGLSKDEFYCFGNREIDMKSFHQLIMMANNQPFAGGLSRSFHKWGGQFKGRAHDAEVDAYNTAMFACKIYKALRGIKK